MTCYCVDKNESNTKPCILELYSWATHTLRNTSMAPTSQLCITLPTTRYAKTRAVWWKSPSVKFQPEETAEENMSCPMLVCNKTALLRSHFHVAQLFHLQSCYSPQLQDIVCTSQDTLPQSTICQVCVAEHGHHARICFPLTIIFLHHVKTSSPTETKNKHGGRVWE